MATIDKLYKSMGLPMNIKRGNPWPLDVSSLWYSYDEMKTYAEDAAGVSYVGQILALVDETNNTATAYIIADEAGTLKPVGAGPVVDERTMMVNEESEELGLKDFGERFYKYIPEVKDAEGNVILEASYELTEVSETNPWAVGLEPRVVSEEGILVLGWFEPNPTTIEGVNNQVSSIQSSVADLQKVTQELVAEIGEPAGNEDATGLYALIDTKADAANVYTKQETADAINAAVNAADHLQRKVVGSYTAMVAFIDANPDIASKYIYMVDDEDATDSDAYDEYMYVEGKIEPVGKWTTDLSDYVTETELTTTLANYVTNGSLATTLGDYATTDTTNSLASDLGTLNATVANKVDKVEGSRLITEEEAQKLKNLSETGEENYVKSTTSDFSVSDTGELSLNKDNLDLSNNTTVTALADRVDALSSTVGTNSATLTTLQNSLSANTTAIETLQTSHNELKATVEANTAKIDGLTTTTNDLSSQLASLTTKVNTNENNIGNVLASLNNYVLKSDYDADIAEIRDILTWKDMEDTSAA